MLLLWLAFCLHQLMSEPVCLSYKQPKTYGTRIRPLRQWNTGCRSEHLQTHYTIFRIPRCSALFALRYTEGGGQILHRIPPASAATYAASLDVYQTRTGELLHFFITQFRDGMLASGKFRP